MLEIHVDGGRRACAPGDRIRGTLQWMADAGPGAIELRLLWYTQGRGDRDAGVAERLRVDAPPAVGSSAFDFTAPSGPYSCSGRLVSICWALEAVTGEGDVARVELVIAPHGREVLLVRPEAREPDAGP